MKALFVMDRSLVDSLQPALEEEGVWVEAVEKVAGAEVKVRTDRYDAVLLDRDRLGSPGYSRLLRWRQGGLKAHVLVLLPDNCDSIDKVKALDAGADAYLVRPFCVEELRAHFRALGRRDEPAVATVVRAHDVEIDTGDRRVRRAGQAIDLTPREFDLLWFLVQRQGRVVSRSTIHAGLYGDPTDDHSNVVDVYIRYLRSKIDKGFDTPLILTRWGQGYLFRAEGA